MRCAICISCDMKYLLQIVYASLGTLGFCLVFNIEKRHAIIPAIGGGVCWGAYLLFRHCGLSLFTSTFFASALIGLLGELISVLYSIPPSVFDVPACIPLIPGSNLYYALASLIARDYTGWKDNTVSLALYAIGIATGLAVVMETRYIFMKALSLYKSKK